MEPANILSSSDAYVYFTNPKTKVVIYRNIPPKGEIGSNSRADRISDLPKGILQRILYFLSQEEAVRTSVLSKSWRDIWCTRPNLVFSDNFNYFKGKKHEFISLVNSTVQRYCDQRLSLEEFHLRLSIGYDDDNPDHESATHLENWIRRLANMGTKEFYLSIRPKYYKRYRDKNEYAINLPSVVFEAESLRGLRVVRYKMDTKDKNNNNNNNCKILSKHLKRLHLEKVIIDDKTFQHIISGCPLIETMSLESCEGLKNIKVSGLCKLKKFVLHDYCGIEIDDAPSLEIIKISSGKISFHESDFRSLNILSLAGVELRVFSSCKFPSLKRLDLTYCYGFEDDRLFIDAPNIIYFRYQGDFIPSISFAPTSNEWDSIILIPYEFKIPGNINEDSSCAWFLKLHELLESLSQSKIVLDIEQCSMNIDQHLIVGDENDYSSNKLVVVEKLNLSGPLNSSPSTLLNLLLRICRPRIIGDYAWNVDTEFMEF